MNTQIFEAFDSRRQLVTQYMAGAKLEPRESQPQQMHQQEMQMQQQQPHQAQQMMNDHFSQPLMGSDGPNMGSVNASGMGHVVGSRTDLFCRTGPRCHGITARIVVVVAVIAAASFPFLVRQ